MIVQACNLQTVPQRQTRFCLNSSLNRLTFHVVHTELSWTRYFGFYFTVLSVISRLLVASRALPFSHNFAPLVTFLIYAAGSRWVTSLVYLLNGKCSNEMQIALRLTSMLRVATFTEVSSVSIQHFPLPHPGARLCAARDWLNGLINTSSHQFSHNWRVLLFVRRLLSLRVFKNERNKHQGGQSTRKRGPQQQGLGPSVSPETVRFKRDIKHWTGLREQFEISAVGK